VRKVSRTAFSLFELLVILAIIGLLLALLLPAIAKVRQAANRAKSQNNLKQLGLASHNYHDSYRVFPPGVDDNHFSAAARLLPFIEQENLFRQIDFKKPVDDQANAAARQTVIPIFLSPDDPLGQVKAGPGPTNYLYNAGSKPALEDNDGIFYQNSKIDFAHIPDGTSNTLMIGETLKGDGGTKAVDVRRQYVLLKKDALKDLKDEAGVQEFKDNQHIAGDRCASWMDGRFLDGTFTGSRKMNDPKPDVSCGRAGGLSGLRGLNTSTNIALCDGSVRAINQSVDLRVWKLLAGRNDGEPIPDF
jgi:type II secretory pathway pseudopilin PulG